MVVNTIHFSVSSGFDLFKIFLLILQRHRFHQRLNKYHFKLLFGLTHTLKFACISNKIFKAGVM